MKGYDKAQLKAYTADLKTEAEGFKAVSKGNGEYSISFAKAGDYCVVATAENNAIIPAVCKVSVRVANGFADVKETDYYYEATLWGSANNIVRGFSADEFAPNAPCTRAQIVTFLYRLAGSPEVSGSCKFADVTDKNYIDAITLGCRRGRNKGHDRNHVLSECDLHPRAGSYLPAPLYGHSEGRSGTRLHRRHQHRRILLRCSHVGCR